ncbi:MAG: DUF2243 domain-containing protein [Bacteroidetes bacterium]|nr:DUF2243 domain-containing protein [Bacteroidota bacterium]
MVKVLLPFPVIGLIIILINRYFSSRENETELKTGPLLTAGFFLGLGMGVFLDGILLHQLLQWHQIISNVLPPDTLLNKQVNTFWDGILSLFTWGFTVTGLILLWRLFFKKNVIITTRLFVGSLLLGWGIFNATDSILNHYILQLHNIRDITENPMLYNHVFFAFAIVLILVGWRLVIPKKAL